MEPEIRPTDRRTVLQMGMGMALAGTTEPAAAQAGGWQPDPKLLADLEQRRVSWIFRETDVPPYSISDPLVQLDGSRVGTRRAWEQGLRSQTLGLFQEHVYGRSAPAPERVTSEIVEQGALGDGAGYRRVRLSCESGGRRFTFPYGLVLPNGRRRPPLFLLINNRAEAVADVTRAEKSGFWPVEALVARGFATAVFRTQDVDPDSKDESLRTRGVRGVWPRGGGRSQGDGWATLSAWAWAASRVLDSVLQEDLVHPRRLGVVGHSRGGKTALWAGAQDSRFTVVVSNNSGCGGAALSRRRFGETVAAINRSFPYWFCSNFQKYNDREGELPVDQHQLLALIAPRGLYVASADGDFWADQRGEFLSLAHASPVYSLYGHKAVRPEEMPPLDTPLVRGTLGYHVRRGGHDLTAYDWDRFMDFAEGIWRT